MYTELCTKPAKYAQTRETLMVVGNSIQHEKLQLLVELDVLTEHLNAQAKDI